MTQAFPFAPDFAVACAAELDVGAAAFPVAAEDCAVTNAGAHRSRVAAIPKALHKGPRYLCIGRPPLEDDRASTSCYIGRKANVIQIPCSCNLPVGCSFPSGGRAENSSSRDA